MKTLILAAALAAGLGSAALAQTAPESSTPPATQPAQDPKPDQGQAPTNGQPGAPDPSAQPAQPHAAN